MPLSSLALIHEAMPRMQLIGMAGDGTVLGWGTNSHGQLADIAPLGKNSTHRVPVLMCMPSCACLGCITAPYITQMCSEALHSQGGCSLYLDTSGRPQEALGPHMP